ncbi:MAG: AMP-binding protein [Acidimicrobiia bacterium]
MVEGPVPARPDWVPDSGSIAESNVGDLMRRVGASTLEDLHGWSVENPAGFWSIVIDDLDIAFTTEPLAVLGSSNPEAPKWLDGARLNIAESCLDADPASTAVIHGTPGDVSTMTVGELRGAVARFASGFTDAGYSPGDRIAIAMPMTVEAVVAYLGVVAAGGVVVSIADSFAPDEIRVRLDLTEPVAVVTQDVSVRGGRTLAMYAKCTEATDIPCIVVDTGSDIALRRDDLTWSQFQGDDGDLHPVAMLPGDHSNILFSSGTTGEPKAIPWTHVTPIKAAMDGRYHQDIHAGDIVAWPTNLGWMMGPWLIYAALLNDAVIALCDDVPTSRAFVEFVNEAEVTMLGLVPSIVSTWRSSNVLSEGDWSTVRVVSSTGEASNPDDYAWLMRSAGGVPVVEYCGGTEIGGGYLSGTVVQPAFASRFTTPTLGLDLVLLDDAGGVSDNGEVFLIGPSIGLSEELLNRDHHAVYFAATPLHERHLRRHGDQLVREPDGTFRALGRVDDTMNLGGVKVSSAELEATVAVATGVAEVAAVSVPPPDGGPDRLIMFVVPTDDTVDGEALRTEMQSEIRSHLNPLFRIDELVMVDALPRTASHKVMRRVLRTDYQA